AKVKREALTLRIVGLIDSSGFVFDADGFSPRRLAGLGAAKAKGAPLAKATGGRRASAAEAVAFVARHALSNPILVDLTADETTPREDLSGMDVARKALILGRLLGFPGELDDIAVESLVPDGAGRLKLDQFLASLEQFDAAWAKRVAAARARGGVLRYRAIVTRKSIRVGLVVVDASSPMASLNGTDNQFIFTTMRYKKNPLVITGPGAGPAVTAGGILNDVLKLAGA